MRPQPVLLLAALLLLALPVAAECLGTVTLGLEPSRGTVVVNGVLSGTFAVENATPVTTGYDFLGEEPAYFSYEDGAFAFTPGAENETRILFYAATDDGCVATRLGRYEVLSPPALEVSPLPGVVTLREGGQLLFAATSDAPLSWTLDGLPVGEGESYAYRANYTAAGNHTLVVTARGERLSSNGSWRLVVRNTNRPPIQLARLPEFRVPLHRGARLNLSLYFFDPDRTPLAYEPLPEEPGPLHDTAAVDLAVQGSYFVFTGRSPGRLFVSFAVTDPAGAGITSTQSLIIVENATVQRRPLVCGDLWCVEPEDCGSCPVDCGECAAEECVPYWSCGDWGACTPAGYQYRACEPLVTCGNETAPPTAQECAYVGTCSDGLKGATEEGIDCGGPCGACPTCSDGVRNQGEELVDCGGPCGACPSCEDGVRNQQESGVDCGGPCAGCPAGGACNDARDCATRACIGYVCVEPTCTDGVRNQGEELVDCGGPCGPCPTCTDGVRNDGELGVDCGGPCGACPTCEDGERNQGETLADCGGPCGPCTLRDWAPYALLLLLLPVLVFALWLLRAFLMQRFRFLLSHERAIHFFYEDDLTYALLRSWNGLRKHFRLNRRKEMRRLVEQAVHSLALLRGQPDATLRGQLLATLRRLYASLFNIGEQAALDVLVAAIRTSKLPFSIKVIALKNTKLLATLELTKLYTDAGFALEEALDRLEELRRAF